MVAGRIAERTRNEWAALLEGTDACAVPVLTITEAPDHAHNRARTAYVGHEGVTQPAPAPRLGRTPGRISEGSQAQPLDPKDVLEKWGA